MRHHVFHDDDYADAGGIGLSSFETQEQAMAFIASRMKLRPNPDLRSYTYIVGDITKLEAAQRVTEVRPV